MAATLRFPSSGFVQQSEAEVKQAAADAKFLRDIDEGNDVAVLGSGRTAEELNVGDECQRSAVHKAMFNQTTEILKFLLDSGARVDFYDKDGAQPIVHAIRADNSAAVNVLLALKKADGSHLIDLGQTISCTGNTLLHEAAWYDRVDIAKILLETGSFNRDFLAQNNKSGQTAMHVAAFRATPAFIQLLVEHGGSVDATTVNPRCLKETPMQVASTMGKPANAKHLQDLSVALTSIRFASRMRRRSSPPPPVLQVRFDYDLKFFTADLEKSFLARLAMHAGTSPEMLYVHSRTAGSVILQLEVSGSNAVEVMEKMESTSLAELSEVVGYPVLSCAVVQRTPTDAKQPVALTKGTPGYNPLAVCGSPQQPRRKAADAAMQPRQM